MQKRYLLWFNFILGSIFIFLCFILFIIHYHTQKQRKIKTESKLKLNTTYISPNKNGCKGIFLQINHIFREALPFRLVLSSSKEIPCPRLFAASVLLKKLFMKSKVKQQVRIREESSLYLSNNNSSYDVYGSARSSYDLFLTEACFHTLKHIQSHRVNLSWYKLLSSCDSDKMTFKLRLGKV